MSARQMADAHSVLAKDTLCALESARSVSFASAHSLSPVQSQFPGKLLAYEVLSCYCMGLLVHEALGYKCMRP